LVGKDWWQWCWYVSRQNPPCLIVCWERNVGRERNVGWQWNVGRESLITSVRQSVGKYMLVGKGLCRPDLQWPTRLVGETHSQPTFCWCKQLSRPICLFGILCCGVVTTSVVLHLVLRFLTNVRKHVSPR
jgi:hypothetical protein